MTHWLDGMVGALSAAAVGIVGLVVRRFLYGRAEDEQMATKAAHEAVEAVGGALSELRAERAADRRQIEMLVARGKERDAQVLALEARVRELEHSEQVLQARLTRLTNSDS